MIDKKTIAYLAVWYHYVVLANQDQLCGCHLIGQLAMIALHVILSHCLPLVKTRYPF